MVEKNVVAVSYKRQYLFTLADLTFNHIVFHTVLIGECVV